LHRAVEEAEQAQRCQLAGGVGAGGGEPGLVGGHDRERPPGAGLPLGVLERDLVAAADVAGLALVGGVGGLGEVACDLCDVVAPLAGEGECDLEALAYAPAWRPILSMSHVRPVYPDRA
jgi:hypothetical protein